MTPLWHMIDECVSTQDVLKSISPRAGWTCVLAERQTGGRGRYGREWQSINGNMFLSVYIEPDVDAGALPSLALVAGLSLWQTIAPMVSSRCNLRLKWPNDLLLNGRKLAGILVEKEGDGAIIGVGVNIKSFPKDTPYPATSLMNEAMNITPAELARAFVQQLQKLLPLWEKNGFSSICDDYIAACIAAGSEIRLRLPDGELSGTFCGISESGALIIETGGHKQELQAGEIMELRS